MGSVPRVRIGYALGTRTRLNDDGFAIVVDALERLAFDSLWLSERIGGEAPDPLVGMAFAAGRTTRLKFGMSVMVLPGRNPIVLAKELATLDRLSKGRLLPAFGLGVADPHEQQAFGVERGARAKLFDEALTVLRGAWAEGTLTHHGDHFDYDGLRVLPKPQQSHLDVWLGGIAPSELRRIGRLADGWLPSFVTPDDAARGREAIEKTLAEHGRTIDDDHYGALIPYSSGPIPQAVVDLMAKRRPDLADPSILVPIGWDALMATIDKFVAVGTSKFVILPIVEPASPQEWVEHLERAAPIVLAPDLRQDQISTLCLEGDAVLPAHPLPEDPIDLAHASWKGQGWEQAADGMAVVTSIMRVQQVLLARVEAVLRPLGLTFARYEVLMLLRFSRTGCLPVGKIGERLQVHPASVTNAVQRLELDGFVKRTANPSDGRSVLAEITASGRRLTDEATPQLNAQVFSTVPIPASEQREIYSVLKGMRRAFGDFH